MGGAAIGKPFPPAAGGRSAIMFHRLPTDTRNTCNTRNYFLFNKKDTQRKKVGALEWSKWAS
jgi:hypothetical protein